LIMELNVNRSYGSYPKLVDSSDTGNRLLRAARIGAATVRERFFSYFPVAVW